MADLQKSSLVDRMHSLAARVPEPKRVKRVLRRMTTPLLPDDYTQLIHPLWSSRELRGEIVKVTRETPDVVTLVIRSGWGASPDYRAGQYIGIGVLLDGRWTWRSYSLTSVPTSERNRYSITVKAQEDGKLSNHLVGTVTAGTVVRLAAPAGDFHLPEPAPSKMLFVTAGSGITPVMGMLRHLRRDSGSIFPDVHHIHSARREDDVIFLPELTEMAGSIAGYTLDLQLTSLHGRFDPHALDERVPDWRERQAWVCGPNAMIDATAEKYNEADLGSSVHSERFTIERKSKASGGTVRFGSGGPEVSVDGATTLLEAGESAGVQLAFGCRMGICQTCVVALEGGYVHDLRSGHEHGPGERIQTCVSVASGDVELKV